MRRKPVAITGIATFPDQPGTSLGNRGPAAVAHAAVLLARHRATLEAKAAHRPTATIARAAIAAAVALTVPVLLGYVTGIDAGLAGVPGESSCSRCHGTAPGTGAVAIAFPGALTYSPAVRQHLVVSITDPSARRWGFELTARQAATSTTQAGSFTPAADGFTQLVCAQPDFRNQVFGSACTANGLPLQYIQQTQPGTRLGTTGAITFEFDWTPPATSTGSIAIYVAAVAANGDGGPSGDRTYTAHYTLSPASATPTPPAISSVVNGASFQSGISAGSWVTIVGTNLSSTTRSWTAADFAGTALPTQLDNASVKINGKSAYPAYVSPTQINVQAPADTALGPVPVEVTNNSTTSPAASAQLQTVSPAFFLWSGKYAVATHTDYSLAAPAGLFTGLTTVPAKPGETIILWGTGFGPTDPAVSAGVLTPAAPVARPTNPVTVTIANLPVTVVSAALTSANAGLYQIAIQVPAAAPDGDLALTAQSTGIQSPAGVLLTVKH